ncbi:type III secretion system translocon subunit SctE [Vibrio sp. S4M6]|uniref:type III secretion system translocon subunit SctE n=1 Tax=Vibrio sinus TaxID=2946865 RepID=UPI00202AB194|nr:type III secretion system translocon subunit SctE [Vibrio sinus]MCL9783801.1 type III secretion system translocon subunit SctE [Vibrio sinus]
MTQNFIRNDVYRATPQDPNIRFDSDYDDSNQVGELSLKSSQWTSGRASVLDSDSLGIRLPEPKNRRLTSQKQADEALNALLKQLDVSSDKSPNGSSSNQLSGLSVDSLALYISLLVTDGLNSRAKDLIKSMDALHDTQKAESAAKLKDQIDAINKNIEQSHKAQKHNIFTAVIDWVVSAVEVVVGALKIAAGVATGNPLAIASGIAEVSAGVMGLVKASIETAALCESDPEKAKKLRDVAEKIGYAQMALEGVAAVLDITQTAKGMIAASKAAKAAEGAATATEMGAKVATTVALEASGKITKAEAQTMLKEITKELTRELIENATKEVTKGITGVAKDVVKEAATKASIKILEEAAEKAIKEAAEIAAQKLAKEGFDIATKEGLEAAAKAIADDLVKTIGSTVKKEVAHEINRVTRAILNQVVNGTTAITTGVQSFTDFALERKMADLRKEVADLLADQQMANQFLDVLNQLMDKQRTRVKETLKMISDGQSTTQSNIENLSNATGMMAGMMGKV